MGGAISIEDLKTNVDIREKIISAINSTLQLTKEYSENEIKVTTVNANASSVGSSQVTTGSGVAVGLGNSGLTISQSITLEQDIKSVYAGNFISKNSTDAVEQYIMSDLLSLTSDNPEEHIDDFFDPKKIMEMLGFNVSSAEFDFANQLLKYKLDTDSEDIADIKNEHKLILEWIDNKKQHNFFNSKQRNILQQQYNVLYASEDKKTMMLMKQLVYLHLSISLHPSVKENGSQETETNDILKILESKHTVLQNQLSMMNISQALTEFFDDPTIYSLILFDDWELLEPTDGKSEEALNSIKTYRNQLTDKLGTSDPIIESIVGLQDRIILINQDITYLKFTNQYIDQKYYDEILSLETMIRNKEQLLEDESLEKTNELNIISVLNAYIIYYNSIYSNPQILTAMSFDELMDILSSNITINFDESSTEINKKVTNIKQNIERSLSNFNKNSIYISAKLTDSNLEQNNKAIQQMFDNLDSLVTEARALEVNASLHDNGDSDSEDISNSSGSSRSTKSSRSTNKLILIILIVTIILIIFIIVFVIYKRKNIKNKIFIDNSH